ncbi:hypothetical protein BIY24_05185 [Halobacteriovorax marinus]|nr:hypothetical protein [Halobacteriovorax marinus]ATH07350.1 hypothetical protein BIY24_05185 [Halobacteriovorax marinus]
MKKLMLLVATVMSLSSIHGAEIKTEKSLSFYQDLSCFEITNIHSEDSFIRFAASEIITDLGKDVCSRVQSIESLEYGDEARSGEISAVQFGKLVESIHTLYTSEL